MRKYFLFILLLITACNLPVPHNTQPATPVDPENIQLALAETSTPAPPNIPSYEKYTLNTIIDYDRHSITVDETITYPNHTGQPLNSLTLAIAANLWPNCFNLTQITVDNIPVTDSTLNAHRLDIPLQTPLAPDSVLTVTLSYSLSLPYMDQAGSLRARIFGYSDIQMNLVNWYPFVVPFKDGEWMIREPWSHGEYLIYPVADFEVNLKFANPENAPIVAASGFAESNSESTRYTLTEGRAFAISASRNFQVSHMQVGDVTVYSYYFPIFKSAGEAAMIASAQALQVFSEKFGAYPHKTLSVVIADFKDSMEFSALFFHSSSFYNLYDGTPFNYLTFVAVHETGHQWWFDQVANDQALEPWLDESLTTYSESLYYEALYPDQLSWWWSYRIDFFEPQGYIDIPVYDGQNDENYKHIVYFNGAHFIKDLRSRIGDEAFFAFIQEYARQNKGGIAAREDFFRILDKHTDMDYSDIVREYFRTR
ncbi:MAG: M1 family metallopeptidase [Anaerolineales bacterium]|nr:M1 family metallopeptidase [Anaerolineales bacterium]